MTVTEKQKVKRVILKPELVIKVNNQGKITVKEKPKK